MFPQLPPQDLMMAVLVNSKWRTIGEDPSLWKWCSVTVHNRNDINNLSIRRLQYIEEICVHPKANWQVGDWKELFLASIRLPKLKEIAGLNGINLTAVEPGLLARAIAQLEVVNLCGTEITNDQAQSLFQAMSQNCLPKKLNISCINQSSVEPGLLARALAQLENVNLSSTEITNDQAQSLFQAIAQNCLLKKMDISCLNLSSVEPGLFGRAVSRLEGVDLFENNITTDQVKSLFQAMSQPNIQLKKLNMGGNKYTKYRKDRVGFWSKQSNNLSSLEPELFGRSLSRLEDVNLYDTIVTIDQVQELFLSMSQNCQLKKLVLKVDNLWLSSLSFVEAGLLARVLSKLEDVFLYDALLTTDQVQAAFQALAQNCLLNKLALRASDISSVEAGLLARVVSRLEVVDLSGTDITTEQIQELFQALAQNCRLKKLYMGDNNLSSVEPELLAKVVNRVEVVWLQWCHLTTKQLTSILRHLQEDSKLKELVLHGNKPTATGYWQIGIARKAREKLGHGLDV